MHLTLKSPNLPDALRSLQKASKETTGGLRRALFRCGALAKRVAVQYAPISPTAALLVSKKPATGATPGGLMRSINFASDDKQAEVFVPSNSEAGKYAFRIHEEKCLSWWRRGPGTTAKGPQADDKFIIRAIQDSQKDMVRIVDSEMEKVKL